MAFVGSASLFVALVVAVYAVGASLYGARTGRREYVVSARYAMYSLAGLLLLCMVILEAAYARSDFSFKLVAQNSSTDTPTFYKFTALWSSQEGSLLLWALLLSIYSSVALHITRRKHREIVPYATAVLGGIGAFFIALMTVWHQNPFATLSPAPVEGNGLEPLLRHPAMMIHPPMLYSGYVGFAIPFAFAVGALVTRRTDADWLRTTRRFGLAAWTFLGCGILLGALWSYTELGWGGYWGWDAVENAAVMPWLAGTAFLHSIMVQERRGMLKVWNASLVCGTFILSLLGTFLVRSGALDSIHAFGASTLGTPFLAFIALVLVGSTVLILSRLGDLRSEARLDSMFSREAFFLLNNLVLVALTLVIFWGTFFPIISEAFTGERSSVGPPYFERLTTPLAVVLVLLAGIGPVLAWRRVTLASLRRAFVFPLVAAALALVLMLVATPAAESGMSLVMFTLIAFVLAVVAQEFWRGTSARRSVSHEPWPVALGQLVARNRRRYGGYVVHAGIAILFVGVAASSAFQHENTVSLSPGQSTKVGGYTVTYTKPSARFLNDRSGTGAPVSLGAVLDVSRGSKHWTMNPARNYYRAPDGAGGVFGQFFNGASTSEVDLKWGATRDFWIAMVPNTSTLNGPIAVANRKFASSNADVQALIMAAIVNRYTTHAPPASFHVLVSPLIVWIWVGGAVVLLGALTAIWPSPEARRRRVSALYGARLGRELATAEYPGARRG
ncbi:MAG: heme lyase CcmF/NrfE family subunit [Thermoleophilaceae bacterium]